MKNIKLMYLTIALLAMIANDAAWARGGHGGGHSGGHFAGGGSHVSGGGHHFRGGHRHSRHNHLNLGFNFGGYNSGFYGYNYYGPRYYGYGDPFFYPRSYNYGSTVIMPMTPPVYIQKEEVTPTQPQVNYWHYCRDPDGYYPYVEKCPGGWLQVAPQPSDQ